MAGMSVKRSSQRCHHDGSRHIERASDRQARACPKLMPSSAGHRRPERASGRGRWLLQPV